MARKPVGITWAEDNVVVVCDDGSVYWTSNIETGSNEAPPAAGLQGWRWRAKGFAGGRDSTWR